MGPRGLYLYWHRVVALFALLLAVAWVPLTSHELLESAGWIHHDSDSAEAHHSSAHDAADGHCRLDGGQVILKAPVLLQVASLAVLCEAFHVSFPIVPAVASPLRRATESPPGLVETWQFALRLALPSRAPALVS